jgi:hypothetical protein
VNRPSQAVSPKPWLRNSHWASRELLYQGGVGWPVLGLAYLVGAACLALAIAMVREPDFQHWSAGLGFAVLIIVILAWLARLKLRHIRYGDTVCHLITLPGVVGGWFKADVECGLPAEAGTVTVRLRNVVPTEDGERMLWSMEQLFGLAPMPRNPARCIVNIRLRVPRHPSQRPLSPSMRFVLGGPIAGSAWILELEKKRPGLDFLAQFAVPIYDTPDAPAEEQEPE